VLNSSVYCAYSITQPVSTNMVIFLLIVNLSPAFLVQLLSEGLESDWEFQGQASRYICKQDTDDVTIGPGTLPKTVQYIQVENCHQVDLQSSLFNYLDTVYNITIRNVDTVVIHPDLHNSEVPPANSYSVGSIELHNIRDLQVRQYAFRSVHVTHRFYLGEVNMTSVVPMSLAFEYVKEFSVFASNFDKISMWGIKLNRCREFNILGMTHFTSLASHAIKARCEKFSMAYNWFGSLQDSSFEVEYILCDIQGNTFVTLAGKPFLDLKPTNPEELQITNEISMSGFIFRENKFASVPELPFGSLAMPFFDRINKDSSYVDIDNNRFACSCDRMGWLLAYGQHGYNSRSISHISKIKGTGSLSFIRQIYQTSGNCVACSYQHCSEKAESVKDYAANNLIVDDEVLRCSYGVPIKNYDLASATGSNPMALPNSATESKSGDNLSGDASPTTATIYAVQDSTDFANNLDKSQSKHRTDRADRVPTPNKFNSSPGQHTSRGNVVSAQLYYLCTVALLLLDFVVIR